MLSNEEFKSAMPQTKKFEGEKPLEIHDVQNQFAGATALKPPTPGYSN
jgi:hypothetical protein